MIVCCFQADIKLKCLLSTSSWMKHKILTSHLFHFFKKDDFIKNVVRFCAERMRAMDLFKKIETENWKEGDWNLLCSAKRLNWLQNAVNISTCDVTHLRRILWLCNYGLQNSICNMGKPDFSGRRIDPLYNCGLESKRICPPTFKKNVWRTISRVYLWLIHDSSEVG